MKTLDEVRREATLAALQKARLRQAEEHRLKVLAERQQQKIYHGTKAREKIANGGIWLRRCLNPDCLVWFATTLPKANWCCEECQGVGYENIRKSISGGSPVPVLARHALLVSKRNARIYDCPKLTPYARMLVSKVDAGHQSIEDVLHAASVQAEQRTNSVAGYIITGLRTRGTRFSYQEPASSFAEAWYIIGCDISAAFPARPCDHSGFH